jgi:ribosomal protein L9
MSRQSASYIEEMGIVNTARFIQQFTLGVGDSLAEKERLYGSMTVTDIATAIQTSKQQKAKEE